MTTPAPKKDRDDRRSGGLSDRSANIITGVVTAVWAASIVAGILHFNGYTSPEGLNTIFTVVVGGAFVLRQKAKDE